MEYYLFYGIYGFFKKDKMINKYILDQNVRIKVI